MCGIAGFISNNWIEEIAAKDTVMRMADEIAHRGPDSFGAWVDAEQGVALSHRRLAIVDLSEAGHQPMTSPSGRYVISFNGEIYNHLELRKLITENFRWRGRSDTETLLALFEIYGITESIKLISGMFAIALWDRELEQLTLIRDRIGEKPLYYGWQKNTFLFGSELKALRTHPVFESIINRDTIFDFFQQGYIEAPGSIWSGINKLMPGTFVQIRRFDQNVMAKPIQYWSRDESIIKNRIDLDISSDAACINAIESEIRRSISSQSVADVPLGAFLSGGVDSSLIVSMMQTIATKPIETFTIGFSDNKYNEAAHAKTVARYLGTNHNELYISDSDARSVIPHLPAIFDEPFSDISAIPTLLLSKFARKQVTVVLTGDGGDELFGGYSRYRNFASTLMWKLRKSLPIPIIKLIQKFFNTQAPHTVDLMLNAAMKVSGLSMSRDLLTNNKELLMALLSSQNFTTHYKKLISYWITPPLNYQRSIRKSIDFSDSLFNTEQDRIEHMMSMDFMSYLPDDILTKVDRTAMSSSLETRIPMLDYRVVEMAKQIPFHMKIRNGQGKWILKQILYKHIPKEIIDRPKMGFGAPVDVWIRGPLREWAEYLLSESKLKECGFLNPIPIRKRWLEHTQGKCNWRDSLWLVLMFQSWFEENYKKSQVHI